MSQQLVFEGEQQRFSSLQCFRMKRRPRLYSVSPKQLLRDLGLARALEMTHIFFKRYSSKRLGVLQQPSTTSDEIVNCPQEGTSGKIEKDNRVRICYVAHALAPTNKLSYEDSMSNDARSFLRNFIDVLGAGIARNESNVETTSSLDPFFHRSEEALPTNITACADPAGMVATNRAFLGISIWVACDSVAKLKSMTR